MVKKPPGNAAGDTTPPNATSVTAQEIGCYVSGLSLDLTVNVADLSGSTMSAYLFHYTAVPVVSKSHAAYH